LERLNFGVGSKYIAVEAAVHLARYTTVRDLCVGKSVLDASCGEGYGTALLARWGARRAVGVDISSSAIESARKNFKESGATYVCASGEELPAALGDAKFDLIVSLETVEHVDDPALFLRNLRGLLADNGTLVMSCPNDHWYYDQGGNNEFHKHRWTFEEFKSFSESVLGTATAWHFGTLAVGFSVTRDNGPVIVAPQTAGQELMLDYVEANSVFAPMDEDSAHSTADTAFYVGVWGANAPAAVFAGFPVSMDMSRQPLFPREGAWMVNRRGTEFIPDWKVNETLQKVSAREDETLQKVNALEDAFHDAQREVTRLGILRKVLLGENELASRSMSRYKADLHRTLDELNESKRQLVDALERNSELESTSVDALKRNSELEATTLDLHAQLASVPWRVVWIWRKLRCFIPTRLLIWAVRIINFARGKKHVKS